MKGIIKHYDETKCFGFIKGENDEDYFFHKNDIFDKSFQKQDFVVFETSVSKKGPIAKNIKIDKTNILYEVPSEIYFSKADEIKGYKTIEETDWFFISSCRKSPDSAKNGLIDFAETLNANAILNLEYFKTTGSESGTGRGTHYYTIHNYKGNMATVAKKSINGTLKKEDLKKGIQSKSDALYAILKDKSRKSLIKAGVIWSIIIFICLASYFIPGFLDFIKTSFNITYNVWVFLPLFIIGFVFGRYRDYTSIMSLY